MILTCPQCATRYFLPDEQVGRSGRPVKCTTCGAVWRALPEPDPGDADLGPLPPMPAVPAAEPEAQVNEAVQQGSQILHETKAKAERGSRQSAVLNAAIWAGLAGLVAVVLVLGVVLRVQVVKLWPRMASAYAAIGMPVNSTGLLIGKVEATPAVLDGRPALTVTGVLTNAASTPRPAPWFKVAVLDRAGKVLALKVVPVTGAPLKVGEARRFSLGVADPPPGYDTVEVTLAVPGAPPAPSPPTPAPARPGAAE